MGMERLEYLKLRADLLRVEERIGPPSRARRVRIVLYEVQLFLEALAALIWYSLVLLFLVAGVASVLFF
ncbi:MAG: hypothetical protein KDG89_01825 [Geminicoccaceae bacterium]|nr:hypothetical protein [Geminicoccaceae bacterium]